MAVTPVNLASSTAPNWLKEAQESLAAAAHPGGLLGTLQGAAKNKLGTIKTFLANSQNTESTISSSQSVADMVSAVCFGAERAGGIGRIRTGA